MKTTNYLIVSSKPWHRSEFETRVMSLPGLWTYIDSPGSLRRNVGTLNPRYAFFLHWNHFVPQEILEKTECVCFHMTDVPYGRGGSPLQNLILRGHKETKLTALKMTKEMDAGPVYKKEKLLLDGRALDIYRRAGEISWEIIKWMVENEPDSFPQMGNPIIFKRRTPSESKLPVTGDLSAIYDFIRMLDAPTYPPAFIKYGDFVIEFYNAENGEGFIEAKVKISKGEVP